MVSNKQLSENFFLYEFLKTTEGQRFPDIMSKQYNPPITVIDSLQYLVTTVWQPIRTWFNCPFDPTSGYRCLELNSLIGSKPTSQHPLGEAADMGLSTIFINDAKYYDKKRFLESEVFRLTGKSLRVNINSNFYLFIYMCLNLNKLDIDQIIHEYGEGKGRPAWVHGSASKRQNRRQILLINSAGTQVLSLREALLLGC